MKKTLTLALLATVATSLLTSCVVHEPVPATSTTTTTHQTTTVARPTTTETTTTRSMGSGGY